MKKLLTSLSLSMALLAGGPAIAQQATESVDKESYSDPASAGTQKTNYNDAELKQFVEAQSGINEIREDYMKKIESSDSQENAQELQMEANDEMVTVIEDAGLDIPTYNAIATAYNSEPRVRNRVDALM
ncbi:DUF4168 domain-containing protein [Marinobacter changyiensis]|uniref:DUF4168 domain-containing protein n=1 Tax=Marinobacter changyiensis TaxID=2604091 RepID=UPI0012647F57|nr:DUF4168 domain-containing protein [Marinobacter changyiensis]